MHADDSHSIRVLHVTDTHLFRDGDGRLLGVNTYESLRDVLKLARELKGTPDLVLLTGDLSQDESYESYERLKELLYDIPAPKYYLPGNHDAPELMHQAFASGTPVIELDSSLLKGAWQIVLLDSTVRGQVGGHLEKGELDRLRICLEQNPQHHALVCLHHQPQRVESRWIDGIGVENGDDLFAVLEPFRQVRAVLWGHIHQHFEGSRDGKILMATPSTCVQFKPRVDDFELDNQPPGFRWLELRSDGSLESQVHRLKNVPSGLMLAARGY